MSRTKPLLLAAVAAGFLPATAAVAAPSQPSRVGVDQSAQVGFTLSGRSLLVNLRPVDGQPNPLVAELSGAPVVVACRGRGPKDGRLKIASAKATWPAGAASFQVRLSKDVSQSPRWCLIEQPGGQDIAVTLKLRIPNPNAGSGTGQG